MASINKVTLLGNVGADPEVRYLPNGTATARLSVATTEKWKNKQSGKVEERTEWHRVILWAGLAKVAGEHVKKGQQIYIEGTTRTRKWTDKDGSERYATEVHAREMQMLGKKADATPASAPKDQAPAPTEEDFAEEVMEQ